MNRRMGRREVLKLLTLGATGLGIACRGLKSSARADNKQTSRLLFVSQGRTGMTDSEGQGVKYFDFAIPNQATWQPGPIFPDGRRLIFLSMEPRRDGPRRPFEEYYTQTPTHIWVYDLREEKLTEIATRDRMAVFYTPALLLGNERILVQVVRNKAGQIFSMDLDGGNAREFTKAGEGLPYGLSLSPDGKRVAFHLASPEGYQVWTSDIEGKNRTKIAAHPDHLYFGTSWSPDGQWILYQDCHFKEDPAHDWSDICLGRADGSEHRVLTTGQAQWFGATYGNPANRGGGSNMPMWTNDGAILFSRKLPGSKVPWEFQSQRPDTDHFNRDFKPDLARGGTQICRLDPATGNATVVTHNQPGVWDFRPGQSPDGKSIAFCRSETGQPAALWVMDQEGANQRLLTRGLNDSGADHPRWLSNG